MNPYEQYSFGSVFHHIPEEFLEPFESIAATDSKSWLEFSTQLKTLARDGYREHERLGGIAGEGGRAGAEGVMLLSLEAASAGYSIPDAQLLHKDIVKFKEFVSAFVTADDYNNQPVPRHQ